MTDLRLVSLCPSTTYTLVDLGLCSRIVGRTRFCIHPQSQVHSIPTVGGTKNPQFEKIKLLKPTHILFNNEENKLEDLKRCQSISETIITTPCNVSDVLEQLALFGKLFNANVTAANKIRNLNLIFHEIQSAQFKEFTYYYLIWKKPMMIAGKGTFIDSILQLFNGKNLASNSTKNYYPQIELSEMMRQNADIVFLSTEPYPFKLKDREELLPHFKQIEIINGEWASWHGTYLIHSLPKLSEFITPLFS